MASPLGHSMMGVAIFMATVKPAEWMKRWGWLLLLVFFSAAADLDYIPALFGRFDLAEQFHRRFTHTLLFSISSVTIYLLIAAAIERKFLWKDGLILMIAMVIHLVIDIAAQDEKEPRGIAPFEPFSKVRFYSPYVIFPNINKGSFKAILSMHNVRVAIFEILFFGILIIIGAGFSLFLNYRKKAD